MLPRCACGNSLFRVETTRQPINTPFPLAFVICSKCHIVDGVMHASNIGEALEDLSRRLKQIEQRLGV